MDHAQQGSFSKTSWPEQSLFTSQQNKQKSLLINSLWQFTCPRIVTPFATNSTDNSPFRHFLLMIWSVFLVGGLSFSFWSAPLFHLPRDHSSRQGRWSGCMSPSVLKQAVQERPLFLDELQWRMQLCTCVCMVLQTRWRIHKSTLKLPNRQHAWHLDRSIFQLQQSSECAGKSSVSTLPRLLCSESWQHSSGDRFLPLCVPFAALLKKHVEFPDITVEKADGVLMSGVVKPMVHWLNHVWRHMAESPHWKVWSSPFVRFYPFDVFCSRSVDRFHLINCSKEVGLIGSFGCFEEEAIQTCFEFRLDILLYVKNAVWMMCRR